MRQVNWFSMLTVLVFVGSMGGPASAGEEPTEGEAEAVEGEEPAEPVMPASISEAVVAKDAAWSEEGLRKLLVDGAFERGEPGEPGESAAVPGKSRGGAADWSKVYKKTAGAVVLLVGPGGSGTGFLIDRDGWLITNYHVADDSEVDDKRRRTMHAYLGARDKRGRMVAAENPLTAVLYAHDEIRDLALMKIEDIDQWDGKVATVSLDDARKSQPASGMEVAGIGNGAVGLRWSMKPGHITAVGPQTDMSDLLAQLDIHRRNLGWELTDAELDDLKDRLQAHYVETHGDTWYVQATSECIPGDSGGPLLDGKGRLMGVTVFYYRMPDGSSPVYFYIHRDEVNEFLEDWPEHPEIALATDFWQLDAAHFRLVDLETPAWEGDGAYDALIGENDWFMETYLAFDLDGDLGHPGVPTASDVVTQQRFDAEFVMARDFLADYSVAMYDLDDVAGFELILVDDARDGSIDAVYRLDGDRHVLDEGASYDDYYLDPDQVPEAWREKFGAMVDLCISGVGTTY